MTGDYSGYSEQSKEFSIKESREFREFRESKEFREFRESKEFRGNYFILLEFSGRIVKILRFFVGE